MTDPVIRLDRSRPFSECRGDRLPDDPHYSVAHWQGQLHRYGNKKEKVFVSLPFDSADELIPDDGKDKPWNAMNSDGKPCTHFPLYSDAMRSLLEVKKRKIAEAATPPEEEEDDDAVRITEDVNFASWLRGEATYDWSALTKAGKTRYATQWTTKQQMVVDLVMDHRVIPENQVTPSLAKLLPQDSAATI